MKNNKSFSMNRRGVFDQLGAKAMGAVTFVIILALGSLVLSTVRQNSNILAVYNATGSIVEGSTSGNANATLFLSRGLASMADFSSWISILVIVTIFAVILMMVYGFYKRAQ